MNGMVLKGNVKLIDSKVKFKCSVDGKKDFITDYIPPLGNGEGYTSLELFLLSLGSCFATSVKVILNNDLNIVVKKMEINIDGIRKETHPTGFKKININMKIESEELNYEILDKVIKTAENKLCPVYSMINNDTSIVVNHEIILPETVSYCGVYCKSCPLYIGTTEEPDRLEYLSERMGKKVEEIMCNGCRSDTLSYYCKECKLKTCCIDKNIENCMKCEDFPCDELKSFQKEMPHRAELWKSLEILNNDGYEIWDKKLTEDFTCCSCRTMNSAYDLFCRNCSGKPGNNFSQKHYEKIKMHLNR